MFVSKGRLFNYVVVAMIPEDIDGQTFCAEVGNDNRTIFDKLFLACYSRLCVYAESIVRDQDVSEDLVQNVFYLLWEKRRDINITGSVKSYLYRAVHNAAINSLKHEKVKLVFFEFMQNYEKIDENVVELLFEEESRTRLLEEMNRAIENLPKQCRDIFMLSRFQGKKSDEIAAELGLSVRTVETQLYRGMKRLREDLAHLKNMDIFLLFILTSSCKFLIKNCK